MGGWGLKTVYDVMVDEFWRREDITALLARGAWKTKHDRQRDEVMCGVGGDGPCMTRAKWKKTPIRQTLILILSAHYYYTNGILFCSIQLLLTILIPDHGG